MNGRTIYHYMIELFAKPANDSNAPRGMSLLKRGDIAKTSIYILRYISGPNLSNSQPIDQEDQTSGYFLLRVTYADGQAFLGGWDQK